MSEFDRLALAISCFLPLFIIFGLENLCEAKSMFSPIENITWRLSLLNQSKGFYFNVSQFSIWLILLMVGIVGIVRFHRKFLKAKKLSKEVVVLVKAENITADYYFTYFSLFVISFFSVDPTVPKDVLIFSFLMVLIIWVYIVNEMYFVNPVLNILRYKSFSIVYHKNLKLEEDDEKEIEEFEIKVFSRVPLNRMMGEKLFVTFSQHDFSVCYLVMKEGR